LKQLAVPPEPAIPPSDGATTILEVYDEGKVPPYDLPPLLVSSEGKPITTPEEWFNVRRPQIMALFGNLVYGIVPAPESPIRTTFEVIRTNREFMDGRATRKDVRIRFENAKGSAEMRILVFTPNGVGPAAPAFLLHSFANTKDNGHDAHPDRPGFLRNGIPLGEFLQRGFGFVVVPQGDLVRHNEEDLPVDQHMLLACIAPRPVYVHSGVEDTWADPRGEYLSAYHASEVYRLLGRKGLDSEQSPPVGEAITRSDIGYHNRPGGHSIEMFDWLKFLEFAERHLAKK
jgi:hypothetical protein